MPTPQAPIASDFNARSTAAEVIRGHDLRGKTAVVTGGSASIGLETTRALSSAGARVIVPARDVEKARAAVGTLGTVEAMELTDPSSIAAFADRFLKAGQPLDLLINNAGIMANPLTRVARNIESQFATNHVGHFELTVRLWPALRRAQAPRIVSLSSVGHRRAPVDFDDWNLERKPNDRWAGYGQSKSANCRSPKPVRPKIIDVFRHRRRPSCGHDAPAPRGSLQPAIGAPLARRPRGREPRPATATRRLRQDRPTFPHLRRGSLVLDHPAPLLDTVARRPRVRET